MKTYGFEQVSRQLVDIQAQADRILKGDNSNTNIESFARFSNEFKDYLLKSSSSENVINLINEIPVINYKRNEIKLWQYLLLPIWWLNIYKDYLARQKTMHEIATVKS